jgi:hypothetical protein
MEIVMNFAGKQEWHVAINLLNNEYKIGLADDEINFFTEIYSNFLQHTTRWRTSDEIPHQNKDNPAIHSLLVCVETENFIKKLNPAIQENVKPLRTKLLKMVLIHDVGEAFGELSIESNRNQGLTQDQLKNLVFLNNPELMDQKLYQKLINNQMDEADRLQVERAVTKYLLNQRQNIDPETWLKLFDDSEGQITNPEGKSSRLTPLAALFKFLERTQTSYWLLQRGNPDLNNKDKIRRNIRYTGKFIGAFASWMWSDLEKQFPDHAFPSPLAIVILDQLFLTQEELRNGFDPHSYTANEVLFS